MQLHARIAAGLVAELIEVPEGIDLATLLHPDLVAACVPVPAGMAVLQGWTWSEQNGFQPPPPPPPGPAARLLRPLAFRRRLSPATRAGLTLAASQAMEAGDATLQVFLDDLAAAREVDLDDPVLAAQIGALVQAGLLTAAEQAALFADAAPDEAA